MDVHSKITVACKQKNNPTLSVPLTSSEDINVQVLTFMQDLPSSQRLNAIFPTSVETRAHKEAVQLITVRAESERKAEAI